MRVYGYWVGTREVDRLSRRLLNLQGGSLAEFITSSKAKKESELVVLVPYRT